MPPTGYLSVQGIEDALQYLATTYPAICRVVTAPEATHEGRTCRAVKLGAGASPHLGGVVLIGGVHAREIVNPDALVNFTQQLCQAHSAGASLTFGGRSYSAAVVQRLLATLDVIVFPLVNPDGRAFVQAQGGDVWWRKNRSPNPGQPCRGVDVNRNYDLLWSSGIGTSADSCSEVFKGAGAFSEPETRNVRWLLDTNPNVTGMIDVHSYSQLILYPWGDDANQTTNPTMNFRNPAYDTVRGNRDDTAYLEYIPAWDVNLFESTGVRIRNAISAVRGRVYTLEQGVRLYPTSGTSNDYAYSRHIVDGARPLVAAYVLETGTEFQPAPAEGAQIMIEVAAGLVEFCVVCACAVLRTEVTGLQVEVADLQEQLNTASPSEKPALVVQIRQRNTRITQLKAAASDLGCPI